MKTAIVTGMIATYPVGGVFWDYAQYIFGFEQMGYEVYYLEDTGWQTYDPDKGMYGDDCSYNVRFLKDTFESVWPGMKNRWVFRSMDEKYYGL